MYSMKRTSRRAPGVLDEAAARRRSRRADDGVDLDVPKRGAPRRRCRRERASRSSRRVRRAEASGSSVSRLTVTRARPAARSARPASARRRPLVVSAMLVQRQVARRGGRPGRQVPAHRGSPPVSRTRVDAERRRTRGRAARSPRTSAVGRAEARRTPPPACSRCSEVAAVGDRHAQVAERPSESNPTC